MADLIQGKNAYIYFMIERKLELVGTGDATTKEFTVDQIPIADSDLSGTVDVNDVDVYVGTDRDSLTAVTVSAVDEKTGKITLSAAPATAAKVFATYKYVYGYLSYAQDYSVTTTLQDKGITPLSQANEESIQTGYKYEGQMKLWNAHDLEDDLMCGVDQEDLTQGGVLATEYPLPAPKHNVVIKTVRSLSTKYRVLEGVVISSLDESTKGGDLGEKTVKLTSDNFYRDYTPTADSGM